MVEPIKLVRWVPLTEQKNGSCRWVKGLVEDGYVKNPECLVERLPDGNWRWFNFSNSLYPTNGIEPSRFAAITAANVSAESSRH